MDDHSANVGRLAIEGWSDQVVAPPFIDPDLFRQLDLPKSAKELSTIVRTVVLPRLLEMHVPDPGESRTPDRPPTGIEIAELARLVLDPSITISADFISRLEREGLSADHLFVDLLEPAARLLGVMWEQDECSFLDVTLGVARLQQLLSMFSRSYAVPSFVEMRFVCMASLAGEQHSFGISMVERFLRAGGWDVRTHLSGAPSTLAAAVADEWFAVVGFMISSTEQLDALAATIGDIRKASRNPRVGIMVGGPPFIEHPDRAAAVGADATAINASAAVVVAQRLLDRGTANGFDHHQR